MHRRSFRPSARGADLQPRTGFRRLMIAVALVSALLLPLGVTTPVAAQPPPGFSDDLVATVDQPTAIAPLADGRLLVASKPGRLLIVRPATSVVPTEALDISASVCSNSERGLLGVTTHPDFNASGGFVYVYYTWTRGGTCPLRGEAGTPPVNRVSRFAMTGDSVDPQSEEILIDRIPSPAGNHNAGDIHFGKDGLLYVSVGDGGTRENAPRLNIVSGKILRVSADGKIPPGNPYQGARTRRCNVTGQAKRGFSCQEVFARGLRNPFRMAFDPDAARTRFFINDVGAASWEEVNVGRRAANYGWPLREGRCGFQEARGCSRAPRGVVNPIDSYRHSTGCSSITGGAFVPNGAWPGAPSYDDAYMYADFVCRTVVALTPARTGGYVRSFFIRQTVGNPVAMAFGSDNGQTALYYATFNGGDGQIRRVAPATP